MVQDICRDIKKLDFAKKHLTNTITALRRLAMLTSAVAGTGSANLPLTICAHSPVSSFASYHLISCPLLLPPPRASSCITDLEEVAGRRDQYKKCANLLEAVQQLMEYFQQYESIAKVTFVPVGLKQIVPP
jgi:hypothetical protein